MFRTDLREFYCFGAKFAFWKAVLYELLYATSWKFSGHFFPNTVKNQTRLLILDSMFRPNKKRLLY